MLLQPEGQIDLEHRAYYLSGNYKSAVVGSQDGYVSVVNFESKSVDDLTRSTKKLAAIALHPSREMFAYVDAITGRLFVLCNPSIQVACIEPPRLTTESSESTKSCFDDCHFEGNRKFLWAVAPIGDYRCEISLIETETWSVVHMEELEDQFGQSSFSFHETYRDGLLSLWMAAGQDGQEVFWLKRRGNRFTVEHVAALSNCTPPAFSDHDSELLVAAEDRRIQRIEYPSMKRLGKVIESPNEDDPFAESLFYFGRHRAIGATCDCRILLIDTHKTRIEDEAIIPGHEPRPIGVYYPTLAEEDRTVTDIDWFTRIGNVIVLIFRRDKGTGLEGWKDSLLWFRVND